MPTGQAGCAGAAPIAGGSHLAPKCYLAPKGQRGRIRLWRWDGRWHSECLRMEEPAVLTEFSVRGV